MIVAVAGGVGAARMLRGVIRVSPESSVTAIVNTGDDTVLHGLSISPDLDTVTYTLAGLSDDERGWGLAGETWRVMERLGQLGGEDWFSLGDTDLATHLFRTELLGSGIPLSEITARLARKLGLEIRLIPMTDDVVSTKLQLADGPEVGFQEYFVHLHHSVPVEKVSYVGAESAVPAPGVLDALTGSDLILICPSNPILSIAPVLAIPGIEDAISKRRHRTVAVSPIIAGAAIKGPADRLMRELGLEASAVGIASFYKDLAATLVIDEQDRSLSSQVEDLGLRCIVAPTIMRTAEDAAVLTRTIFEAVGYETS